MSDSGDYTYEPLTGLARMQARIAELERENAELRVKLDAVPDYVDYRRGCSDWDPEIMTLDEWCERVLGGAVQP